MPSPWSQSANLSSRASVDQWQPTMCSPLNRLNEDLRLVCPQRDNCCSAVRLLLAQNGHAVVTQRFPLLAVKPTWRFYEYTPQCQSETSPFDKDLSGIHDPRGVERFLQLAHERELKRRFVVRQLLALQKTDTVLGADRAAEALGDVVDDAVELGPPRHEDLVVAPHRPAQIQMHISVADMAEGEGTDARESTLDGGDYLDDEIGDAAHRHGDVMLDAGAFVFLSLHHAFADAPEIARLARARGNDAVRHQRCRHRLFEERRKRRAGAALILARGHLEER